MKKIGYYLSILLSVLFLVGSLGGAYFTLVNMNNKTYMIIGIVVAAVCFVAQGPIMNMRVKFRRDVEYDEFGRSKSHGSYEKLSKKERDAIDLQTIAHMETLVNSTMIKKITKEGSKEPEKDLEKLIGIPEVKQKVREMAARMQFERKNGGKGSLGGRHMVFYGPPGVGKTTVARIIAGFLYKNGYIKKNKCVEIDGNTLKAGEYTADKTKYIIQQAYDGVLFIDEAYTLVGPAGNDAIATLIKEMEDNRDRFVVILAGYTNEMAAMIRQNPGFESRIKEYLDFKEYNVTELRDIFMLMAHNAGFAVSDEAIINFETRIQKEKNQGDFANGRTVRNVLEETIDKHAYNLSTGVITESDRFLLKGDDVNTTPKKRIGM